MNNLSDRILRTLPRVATLLIHDGPRQHGLFGAGVWEVTTFLFLLLSSGVDGRDEILAKARESGHPDESEILLLLDLFEGGDSDRHLWRRNDAGLYRALN